MESLFIRVHLPQLSGIHTNTTQVTLTSGVTRTIVSSSCNTQDTILSIDSLTSHLSYFVYSSISETLTLNTFSIRLCSSITESVYLFYFFYPGILTLENMKIYAVDSSNFDN